MNLSSILTFLTLFFARQVTAQNDSLDNCPTVDLKISLSTNTFSTKADIIITLVLTKHTKTNQKLLFDKAKSTTGGPAWTSVSLINLRTGKSVLKYANKAILESQRHTEEQLRDKYDRLRPGQSLEGKYSLFDLAVTNSDNYRLEKGTYEIQVFYCSSRSNKLTLQLNRILMTENYN